MSAAPVSFGESFTKAETSVRSLQSVPLVSPSPSLLSPTDDFTMLTGVLST